MRIERGKEYDAIVVGTGAAGGWAAKELAERGMEILVLKAGPKLDMAKDLFTHTWPYEMKYRGFDRPGERERTYPNQWTASEHSKMFYI
ncbi:MAG: FAD-binding protein [Acidobacteria bacterium]|nr:FAD-binding protein [Acidobacteriota bacterium]